MVAWVRLPTGKGSKTKPELSKLDPLAPIPSLSFIYSKSFSPPLCFLSVHQSEHLYICFLQNDFHFALHGPTEISLSCLRTSSLETFPGTSKKRTDYRMSCHIKLIFHAELYVLLCCLNVDWMF